jgi:cobalamin biosynthesis protein CobT
VPPAAEQVAAVWRSELSEKAGVPLARAQASMHDQTAFSSVMRQLLRDLGMADDTANKTDEDDTEGEKDEEGEAKTEAPEEGEGEGDGEGESQEQESGDGGEGEPGDESKPRLCWTPPRWKQARRTRTSPQRPLEHRDSDAFKSEYKAFTTIHDDRNC